MRVLVEDPDLVERVDGAQRRAAVRLAAAGLAVPPGAWTPGPRHQRSVGLLVLAGWVVRRARHAWGPVAELFGPGDVITPWRTDCAAGPAPAPICWEVLEAAELAHLDARFLSQLAGFPGVTAALFDRQAGHVESVAVQLAAAASKQLDGGLLLLLGHLADRWGRVTPGGLRVPVPLGHRLLAEMVGARRPSVSVALKRLDGRGELRRLPDGTWLLPSARAELAAA